MNLVHIHTVKEVKKGNDKYRPKLMELYNPHLRRLGGYYLNSSYCKHADIEDAVQEVWIKVFKYIELLDDPYKFPAWISRIMKNQCLNMQKRNTEFVKNNVLVDLEGRHDLIEKIENDEIDELDIHQRRALLSVMNELPEAYSDVLKMHYLSGFRIKEIARSEGITESLVKWRLVRARALLKKKMKAKLKE